MTPIKYIRIEADVLYRQDLGDKEKLLLGLIRGLNGKPLTMSNPEIGKMLCTHGGNVSRMLRTLHAKKLIEIRNAQSRYRQIYSDTGAKVGQSHFNTGAKVEDDSTLTSQPSTLTSQPSTLAPARNITKRTKRTKLFRPNSDEFRLSELLLNLILSRKPDFKKPNLQSWAKHIDRMIRLDNRKPNRIREVIRWVQADPFWQNNILSTEKLRKQFDTLELKSQRKSDHGERRRDFGKQESNIGTTIQV